MYFIYPQQRYFFSISHSIPLARVPYFKFMEREEGKRFWDAFHSMGILGLVKSHGTLGLKSRCQFQLADHSHLHKRSPLKPAKRLTVAGWLVIIWSLLLREERSFAGITFFPNRTRSNVKLKLFPIPTLTQNIDGSGFGPAKEVCLPVRNTAKETCIF